MTSFSDKYLSVIQKFYPNATETDELIYKLFTIIEKELRLKPHQIIHADSICSDDVNNIEYPEHAKMMLGPFNLGGLCGFPFAGITGISAFASHVPEDGAVLVYYGPHVGITKSGEIGKLFRMGQNKLTTCCGASIKALQRLLNEDIITNEITELDYQQNIIVQIFLIHKNRIKNSSNKIFETTEVLYEAIEARILDLVETTNYSCQYIILVGGIIINSDYDVGSYFECRNFQIVNSKTGKNIDLISLL